MRFALALTILVSLSVARAQEAGESRLANQEKSLGLGFHWITHHCKADESAEVDSTPQSPPLVVDDPETPGCNKWEINLVADGDLNRNARFWELPLIDLNYGIGDNLQLKYEVPNQVVTSDGATRSGWGDTLLGVKFQFFEDEESDTHLAVYPQDQFFGLGERKVSERESSGTIFTLPILISTRLASSSQGNIMFTGNLAYNGSTRRDTANFLSAAAGIGAPLLGMAAILSELVADQALARVGDAPPEKLLKVDVAVMAPVSEKLMIFGSLGRSLAASDYEVHFYVLSGIRYYP